MRPSAFSAMRPAMRLQMRASPATMYQYTSPANIPKATFPNFFGVRAYPVMFFRLYKYLFLAWIITGYGLYELQKTVLSMPGWRHDPKNPYREAWDRRDAKIAGVEHH